MDEIKQKLLQMREEILDKMETGAKLSASSITHEIGDTLDHASEERDREYHELIKERNRQKLNQINHALEKIKNKTYGNCEECDKKINKKRLIALPFSTLCIQCKQNEEKYNDRSLLKENSYFPSNIGSLNDYDAE